MDAMTAMVIVTSVLFVVGGVILNRKCDKAAKEFQTRNKKR
ncbi:MAG: hypothetical protein Q8930_07880 [Bacillota bacterium]|nr:hypothetical protein [Bacillota bacterium]